MNTLTTTQAAKILDVAPSRVRQLAINKQLKGTKHGRDWSFDPTDVAEFAKTPRTSGYPAGRPRKAKAGE